MCTISEHCTNFEAGDLWSFLFWVTACAETALKLQYVVVRRDLYTVLKWPLGSVIAQVAIDRAFPLKSSILLHTIFAVWHVQFKLCNEIGFAYYDIEFRD